MIDFFYFSSPCFLCYRVYWNTIQKLPLMQEHPGVAVSKMDINQQSHCYHGAQRLRRAWRLKSGLDRPPGGDQVWESLDAVRRRPEKENQSLPEHLSSRKLQKRCTSGAKYEWKRGISLLFGNDILLLFHFTLHYSSFFLSIHLSFYQPGDSLHSFPACPLRNSRLFRPILTLLLSSELSSRAIASSWFLPSRSPPSFPSCFFNRSVLYWRLLLPSGLWKCQNGPLHFQLRK